MKKLSQTEGEEGTGQAEFQLESNFPCKFSQVIDLSTCRVDGTTFRDGGI
jgi:hypothetical protein